MADLLNLRPKRRFVPTWGGNADDPSPFSITYHTPTRGALRAVRRMMREGMLDDAKEGSRATVLAQFTLADAMEDSREALLKDAIVSVDSFTLGGKTPSLEEALDFIVERPALAEEILDAIQGSGTPTDAEEKAPAP